MKTPASKPAAKKNRSDSEPAPGEPTPGAVTGPVGAPDEMDPAAESADWIPTTTSTGLPTPEVGDYEEDGEGQNTSAQLVEEGVKRAEHQQILQAAKDASLESD